MIQEITLAKNAGVGYRPGNNDGFDYQLDSRPTMQVHPQLLMGTGNLFFWKWRSRFLFNEWFRGMEKKYSKGLW